MNTERGHIPSECDQELLYERSAEATEGAETRHQAAGIDYMISQGSPASSLPGDLPTNTPHSDPVDVYEISTEAAEVDVFSLPGVFEEAAVYNALSGEEDNTYREWAEAYAKSETLGTKSPGGFVLLNARTYPLWRNVVERLRAGVTTFPVDYLVLRRLRKVDISSENRDIGKVDLDAGKFIYQTAQLNLPASVAFVLPARPTVGTAFATQFQWGWRMRRQTVETNGPWIEQRIELVLGHHPLLAISPATNDLTW